MLLFVWECRYAYLFRFYDYSCIGYWHARAGMKQAWRMFPVELVDEKEWDVVGDDFVWLALVHWVHSELWHFDWVMGRPSRL